MLQIIIISSGATFIRNKIQVNANYKAEELTGFQDEGFSSN